MGWQERISTGGREVPSPEVKSASCLLQHSNKSNENGEQNWAQCLLIMVGIQLSKST